MSDARSIDLQLDVTKATGIGEAASIGVTVHLPHPAALGAQPIVAFAKPGGGYTRGYFTVDLPGPASGAQAAWHAERGWIFVSVDHLGTGTSSHHDQEHLTAETLAASAQSAEQQVLARLRSGTLDEAFPPVKDPVVLGLGHSMGGFATITQQGTFHPYDGLAALGYSAVHTRLDTPSESGAQPFEPPWYDADAAGNVAVKTQQDDETAQLAWGFFYGDMDPEFVWAEMSDFPARHGNVGAWASATMPLAVVAGALTPGQVAAAAAAVRVPVLLAMAERDVVIEPRNEAQAYPLSRAIDLFICPRMGHMHNFASTRKVMWQRISDWGATVRDLKNAQLEPV